MNLLFIEEVLKELGKRRPVFHSEADLQFEFAWEMRLRSVEGIRLEYPMKRIGELDIFIQGSSEIIEFKYKTKKASLIIKDEHFALKQQSANPLGRYDFLKDVSRIEQSDSHGFCLFLTNDSSYWRKDVMGNGKDFCLSSGHSISGDLAWQEKKVGSLGKNRLNNINLKGTYICNWKEYSETFRYLLFEIKSP
jgi:hypothetical protein